MVYEAFISCLANSSFSLHSLPPLTTRNFFKASSCYIPLHLWMPWWRMKVRRPISPILNP